MVYTKYSRVVKVKAVFSFLTDQVPDILIRLSVLDSVINPLNEIIYFLPNSISCYLQRNMC